MKLNEQNEKFLQRLWNIDSMQPQDASIKASNLRNRWSHLMDTPEICREENLEAEKTLETYAEIVDQMDGTGLNNYAEGALALCSHHRNESSKWKTHLSTSSILEVCKFDPGDSDPDKSDNTERSITIHGKPKEKQPNLSSKKVTPEQTSPNFFQQKPQAAAGPNQLKTLLSGNPTNNVNKQKHCSSIDSSKPLFSSNFSTSNQNSTHSFSKDQKDKNIDASLFPPCPNMMLPGASRKPPLQNPFIPTESNNPQLNSRIDISSTSSAKAPQGRASNIPHQKRESYFSSKSCAANKVEVQAQKIGGPYANFGQKRKQPDQSWRKGKTKAYEDDDDFDNQDSYGNNSYQQNPFRTAKDQLIIDKQKKKTGADNGQGYVSSTSYGSGKRSLGTRRGPASKFVPPILNKDMDEDEPGSDGYSRQRVRGDSGQGPNQDDCEDERLKGIDPKMIELINNEIMDHGTQITWDDIAGLDFAKKTIKEIVVWPMLRPDIFTGLRGPPKGLLLFGPPGTGKTLIGKCIASQSKSTFFCISASSLTSKWVGEGEKMVKALFAVARVNQPAVIFIDEIDSLLSQRSDNEHESSRRIKTEFLVQLDGAATGSEDRILVIGATNRPQEIDEAARRRFVKRLLIPLPEAVARRQIVCHLMSQQNSDLSDADIEAITSQSDGYSGADMTNLCREAALGPIRSIPFEEIETITSEQVRPISFQDFESALLQVRASVSSKDLQLYADWNKTYGSFGH